jgi:hypothetical protein
MRSWTLRERATHAGEQSLSIRATGGITPRIPVAGRKVSDPSPNNIRRWSPKVIRCNIADINKNMMKYKILVCGILVVSYAT